jgi:exosortase
MNKLRGMRPASATLIFLVGSVLWGSWPALVGMANRWSGDPRYAHGYLVPIFALGLLWLRRATIQGAPPTPTVWGVVFLGTGAASQLVGSYFRVEWIEGIALLPYLAGVCLLLGGWRHLTWAWPSIAFLAFMVPLPWRVENALGPPLQSLATAGSTYTLQTLGLMAFAEGNVIQLDDAQIGVGEACSGLSMLMTFVALSTATALVIKRPLLDRVVLVASAIPVALVANIARIVLTGALHEIVGGHAASTFYHDLAGWIMMPLALVLYWIEVAVFSRLLIEAKHEVPSALAVMVSRQWPAQPRGEFKLPSGPLFEPR